MLLLVCFVISGLGFREVRLVWVFEQRTESEDDPVKPLGVYPSASS